MTGTQSFMNTIFLSVALQLYNVLCTVDIKYDETLTCLNQHVKTCFCVLFKSCSFIFCQWPPTTVTVSCCLFLSNFTVSSCLLMARWDSSQAHLVWQRSARTSSHPRCPGAQWDTTCLWNQPTQTVPPPYQLTIHRAKLEQVSSGHWKDTAAECGYWDCSSSILVPEHKH